MKEIKGKIKECKARLADLGEELPVENSGKV